MATAPLPRIISASRRTDIPAFYAEWFMNRVRAGECQVVNPFNRLQVSRVSLRSEDIDVIVFWTRHPRPLFPYLDELDRLGYRYYFQYTLMDNPSWLDPLSPPAASALRTFTELAARMGPQRLIWRYDPMVFMPRLPAEFHLATFQRLAEALSGHTQRVVISVLDEYAKASARMRQAQQQGGDLVRVAEPLPDWFAALIQGLVGIASACNLEIVSCAEPLNLQPLGVRPAGCIDADYIARVFNLNVPAAKDPSQRKLCSCIASKDIGAYDTCLFGCQYCYATSSFETARLRHAGHDPSSPTLI